MRQILEEKIKLAGETLGVDTSRAVLEYPGDIAHGDFATNVAMVCGKEVGKNPRELAESFIAALGQIDGVEKIEIAGPGFINFTLSREYFSDTIKTIDDEYGKNHSHDGKKVLIEKSAPNLFKPFHVGHLLNISVGESLSRLYRFCGADVTDVSYPSDISLGVAKAVWAILKEGSEDDLTIDVMGKAYVTGTKAYEEDEKAKEEIDAINIELNQQEKGDALRVYEKGRELNLEYFETITERLGSTFSHLFFESESGKVGAEIVKAHTPKVFEESNGAIIFKGEDHGLHTRVFLTSKGLPVYEAKDIGLLKLKFDKYSPDLSIVITDIEQKQYFEVIKKAASLINETWGANSLYWQHGRLRFSGGKISSRYGNVPLAEDLIDTVKDLVKEKQSRGDEHVAEAVAIASLKYAFLRSGSGKNVIFDFEKSISVEGDSGPYLQYTYARAKSVLAKADSAEESTLPPEPYLFERLMVRFPEVVLRAASEHEPHYVTTYLTELASAFNSWYAQEKIIGGDYEGYKLALVAAFACTMQNGLYLLGIEAPEAM